MKQNLLEQAGLNKNEAQVYQLVLEHGEITPPQVAEITGITRQNAYAVLKSLMQKELVEEIERKKKLAYKPLPPEAIASYTEKKTREAEMAEKAILSALPEFQSLFNLTSTKPGISYFEGIEGIQKIYEDTLRVGEPIYAFLSPQEVDPRLRIWLDRNYARRRKAANIPAQVIVSQESKYSQYTDEDKDNLRETKIVKSSLFPINIEINIYGNKVAFINFHEKEKLAGFVVEGKLIAEAMRSIFQICWADSKARI